MNKRWVSPEPIVIPDSLQEYFAVSPYLAEALAKKGITDPSSALPFLDYTKYQPASPHELPGVEKATQRVLQAVKKKESIGIWGDFDVDGQTSTALLVSFFRQLGLQVQYHIPIRAEESHGILKEPLQNFLARGIDLLITCDTGISAFPALNFATHSNVDVILTDHHTPSHLLPEAFAIINPHFVSEGHAFSDLSGVGTAFILTRSVAAELNMQSQWEKQAIDLVAMGTIADVAPLVRENRYMVQYGLDRMRAHPRLAVQEVLSVAGTPAERVDEQNVSFTIAPRLNALGRLGDANPMVEFLLTEDIALARTYATHLEGLNNQRKLLVNQVYQAALAQIETDPNQERRSILILSNPAWPAGILGIVANHLVEAYGKPAILLTANASGVFQGSARSLAGINITELLQDNEDLLLSYGGHAMAAGLALKKENLDRFVQNMNASVAAIPEAQRMEATLPIDAYLPLENVNEPFMRVLDSLAPFGAGNPAPLFLAERLQITGSRAIDRDKVHRSIQVQTAQGQPYEVKWWHAFDAPLPTGEIDLAYSIRRSVFRGEESIEIGLVDMRASTVEEPVEVAARPAVEIADFRFSRNPQEDLRKYLQSKQPVCWAENLETNLVESYNRLDVPSHAALALLHMPPSAEVLQNILQKVQPLSIALFDLPQKPLRGKRFLQTLLGMVKFAMREKQGKLSLQHYAALTGFTTEIVKIALSLLEADGQITIQREHEDNLSVARGNQTADIDALRTCQEKLVHAFKVMQAFQRFLLRLPPEQILSDYYERGN